MPKYPVTGPVNTASKLVKPDKSEVDFRLENCAPCTAGALTGITSGQVVHAVFGQFNKPMTPLKGYEPAATFAQLGQESRERGLKGPKFAAPPLKIGGDPVQHELQVNAAATESSTHAQIKAMRVWVHGKRGGTYKKLGDVKTTVSLAEARVWMAKLESGTEFAVYFTSLDAETMGHWIYAENRGHSVEFVDYQQYLPAGAAPSPSSRPSCCGKFAVDAKMIVLAFSP
jgi:hypothetical protein